MTPTARELWNDPAFIEQRIQEQHKYIDGLNYSYFIWLADDEQPTERKSEVLDSAQKILKRFERQRSKLNRRGKITFTNVGESCWVKEMLDRSAPDIKPRW